jgi:hypothetical protein
MWLFDASRDYALPFGTDSEKRHSLDLCVRARDSDATTYIGIVQIKGRMRGVHILPSDKPLNKRPSTTSQLGSKRLRLT